MKWPPAASRAATHCCSWDREGSSRTWHGGKAQGYRCH